MGPSLTFGKNKSALLAYRTVKNVLLGLRFTGLLHAREKEMYEPRDPNSPVSFQLLHVARCVTVLGRRERLNNGPQTVSKFLGNRLKHC